MAEQRTLQAGATVLIGGPAKPLPDAVLSRLRDAVKGVSDASFAYVPQMYLKGNIDPPRQVLYLVLRDSAKGQVERVMRGAVIPALLTIWPKGDFINVLPVFDDHPWLADVIGTGCVLAINDEDHHQRCVASSGKGAPAAGKQGF